MRIIFTGFYDKIDGTQVDKLEFVVDMGDSNANKRLYYNNHFISCFTFLNFRRTVTRLKIEQLRFAPNPLGTNVRPNILYFDGEQSTDLWTVIPILYLIVYVKISNLSYTDITISNFIINDKFLVSRFNRVEVKKELKLSYFSSKESKNRDLKNYGHAVPISLTALRPDDYDFINVGDRIQSKSSIEGVIIIPGNQNLYAAVNEGKNKLTIVTPNKKFDAYIEIDKTVIPEFDKS